MGGNKIKKLWCGPGLWQLEVLRLGAESEWPLPAYVTAPATPDAGCTCDLHHSSWQHGILKPLSEARDGTHILANTSQVLNPLSHSGNSQGFT